MQNDPVLRKLKELERRIRTLERQDVITPRCHLTNSTNPSIPNNTWTRLTWDTTSDIGGFFDAGVDNGRIYAPVSGTYLLGAYVGWVAAAAGNQRNIEIRVNGIITARTQLWSYASCAEFMQCVCENYMAEGDYAEVWVQQASGASLQIFAWGYTPVFTARLVA